MSKQIRRYIARLNEKANLENELRNSELKNLNTQNMLRDAELKALQSQINPHFLFNTLNCIAQTAMFEDAAETNSLIITVSNMLRYNLRRLETPVTLGEEITNLNRYICIQKLRYGDRIHFETDIDEDTLSVQIPCLTIQPIVENAVIHGFESNECGGTIRVDAHRTSAGELLICVEDDGIGMDAQTLSELQRTGETTKNRGGHSTGIGIKNVINRLQLFYGKNIFEITSVAGQRSRVRLRIPADQLQAPREEV